MNLRAIGLFVVALIVATSGSKAEEVLLWGPSDFDGVWVSINDRATNGCWTNIGEARAYAEDQLDLSGFEVVEIPEPIEGKSSSIIDDNHASFVVEVVASRWNDGTCVGHVLSYFLGSTVPRKRQKILIVDRIGPTRAWTIWDNKNLNNYVLDHIKGYIPHWVEFGTTPKKYE